MGLRKWSPARLLIVPGMPILTRLTLADTRVTNERAGRLLVLLLRPNEGRSHLAYSCFWAYGTLCTSHPSAPIGNMPEPTRLLS